MSHMGGPNGWEDKLSLRHITGYLKNLLGVNVYFSGDCIGSSTKKTVASLNNGGGGVGKFKDFTHKKN